MGALKDRLRPIKRRLVGSREPAFEGSGTYWQTRYETGGHSGAGSYGHLARFKADYLNEFVAEHGVRSVIEFGSGDGAQLALAEYPTYLGLDVSPTAITLCTDRFVADPSKSFLLYDGTTFSDPARWIHADLTMSLDVIYHLIEPQVFDTYMRHLFGAADRFVIVYASNAPIPDSAAHVRHREFTPWIEENLPDWELVEHRENPHREPPPTGSPSDFFVYAKSERARPS